MKNTEKIKRTAKKPKAIRMNEKERQKLKKDLLFYQGFLDGDQERIEQFKKDKANMKKAMEEARHFIEERARFKSVIGADTCSLNEVNDINVDNGTFKPNH